MNATKAEPIESVDWMVLNVYRIPVYPHVLIVTTTAETEDVRKALDVMSERAEKGDGANIDAILQEMGFSAVAAEGEIKDLEF